MAKFCSSWRIGVDCDDAVFDKQMELLLKCKGVIDEMALCLTNTDSFAYMPLPDFKKQIDLFPPRAARLRALGIRVGMNLWPSFGSIGHEKGPGRMVNPFRPMVGMDGREEYGLACYNLCMTACHLLTTLVATMFLNSFNYTEWLKAYKEGTVGITPDVIKGLSGMFTTGPLVLALLALAAFLFIYNMNDDRLRAVQKDLAEGKTAATSDLKM